MERTGAAVAVSRLAGTTALLAWACTPSLGLNARRTTLVTAHLECNIAPTQPGPNQIQLRLTAKPECDVVRMDVAVLVEQLALAHDRLERRLAVGVADSFDTSPFPRLASGTLLTVQAKGTCSDGKIVTAASQCRVP